MRYQINNLQLAHQMLDAIHDDLSLPWSAYPCLIWPRAPSAGGYATVSINGPDGRIKLLVHRLAYERHCGPIPLAHDICHHCDNPPCFRPIHLFAGTESENIQDSIQKGRFTRARGSAAGGAKLSEEQVLEILTLYRKGWSMARLGREFSVPWSTIRFVVIGKHWSHIQFDRAPYRGIMKLTAEQMEEIVRLYRETGLSQREVGRRFGVSHNRVRLVLESHIIR